MYHQLPFKSMPRLMIVKGVQECARWLNSFPSEYGYQNISLRTLIIGVELDYRIHCRHSFGSYVQTHQENTIKNSMNERTCDAIFLRTLDTGGYEVMNLQTGKMATEWKLYEVPMTNDVIKQIESLGERDGIKPKLTFEYRSRNNEEYEEEEENNIEHNTESDYNPPQEGS